MHSQHPILQVCISGAIDCYCSNPGYCIIPLNRQHTICQGSRECRLFRVITLNRAILLIDLPLTICHTHVHCLVSSNRDTSASSYILPASIFSCFCFNFCYRETFRHMAGIYRNSNDCFSLFPAIRFLNRDCRCGILSCISSLCLEQRCCQAKKCRCCKQALFYPSFSNCSLLLFHFFQIHHRLLFPPSVFLPCRAVHFSFSF